MCIGLNFHFAEANFQTTLTRFRHFVRPLATRRQSIAKEDVCERYRIWRVVQ